MEENKVMETVTEETNTDLVDVSNGEDVCESSGGIVSALPKIGVAAGVIALGALGVRKGVKWLKNRPHYKLVKVDPDDFIEDLEDSVDIDYDEEIDSGEES